MGEQKNFIFMSVGFAATEKPEHHYLNKHIDCQKDFHL